MGITQFRKTKWLILVNLYKMTEVYTILVKCRDCSCPIATIQVPELSKALAKLAMMPFALVANRTTCLSCGKANLSVECRDSEKNLVKPEVKQTIQNNTSTIKT